MTKVITQKFTPTFGISMVVVCLAVMLGCGGGGSASGNTPTIVLQSIQITPGAPSVAAGLSQQLTATARYSDGTTKDVTNSAAWSSSNTSVATVSSSGSVTTNAQGSTTISASYSGVSGRTTLTVTAAALVSLSVTPLSISIAPGTATQFIATGTFTDNNTRNVTGSVSWASSDPSVASINLNGASGLAKGLAPGTTNITASSGAISSSASLTVTSATLLSIVVTPANPAIPLGTLQQFTATGTFDDSTIQDITATVNWSSSNKGIVSITVSGLATARNLGAATITAISGSISGTTQATVNAANLTSIAIVPGDLTIAAGTSQALSAIGTFSDGSTHDVTSQSVWLSSNTNVAKVSGSGVARAVAPGTSTISATLGSISGSITLQVSNAVVVSISVTPVNRTIAPGTQLSFVATATFSDSSTQIIDRDATWSSDNLAVATVGTGGNAVAVAPGTANISATFGGVTGSALLNVSSANLTSIAVTPATAVLAPASTLGYTAIGTFSDGTTQTITTTVTWTSSAPSVATITGFGQATGQSAGAATITAQFGSVTGTAGLVVQSSPLTSVQIVPAAATVAKQTWMPFTAIGTFGDGSSQDLTASALWTSSDLSIATVSNVSGSKGFATGVAPGTVTITALFAGQLGSASLTVTNATLSSITISPGSANIALGESQQFTATGSFSDGSSQNLSTQVDWTSSNANVATISTFGLATSAGTGTATITAALNGVSATAVLTVH